MRSEDRNRTKKWRRRTFDRWNYQCKADGRTIWWFVKKDLMILRKKDNQNGRGCRENRVSEKLLHFQNWERWLAVTEESITQQLKKEIDKKNLLNISKFITKICRIDLPNWFAELICRIEFPNWFSELMFCRAEFAEKVLPNISFSEKFFSRKVWYSKTTYSFRR